jgi:hypothetical protein
LRHSYYFISKIGKGFGERFCLFPEIKFFEMRNFHKNLDKPLCDGYSENLYFWNVEMAGKQEQSVWWACPDFRTVE